MAVDMNFSLPTRVTGSLLIVALTTMLLSACGSLLNDGPSAQQTLASGTTVHHNAHPGTTPVVVFQSGLGNDQSVWRSVLQQLPASVSTFTYDRPGYGRSAKVIGSRDPCTIARELHELLQASGQHPPYVLVGHSLGGLYQYAFAQLYPQEVQGLLLLDATHPDHWASIQQRTPNTATLLRSLRATTFSETEKREFDHQSTCIATLPSPPFSMSYPAKLLTRTRPDAMESPEYQALSRELAARWSDLVPSLVSEPVSNAGHFIQKDQPQRVVREIVGLTENKERLY